MVKIKVNHVSCWDLLTKQQPTKNNKTLKQQQKILKTKNLKINYKSDINANKANTAATKVDKTAEQAKTT